MVTGMARCIPVIPLLLLPRIYELMDEYKVNLKGAVSWSFEFEDQEWFAGFRELATHGIDKPVLNVFRMFGMMNGKRISVKCDNGLNCNRYNCKWRKREK